MAETNSGWGGKRAGAGRPKGTTKDESNQRKQRQVRAHDEEAFALFLAVFAVMDFIISAVNVSMVQLELIAAADRLNLIDRETLRKEA